MLPQLEMPIEAHLPPATARLSQHYRDLRNQYLKLPKTLRRAAHEVSGTFPRGVMTENLLGRDDTVTRAINSNPKWRTEGANRIMEAIFMIRQMNDQAWLFEALGHRVTKLTPIATSSMDMVKIGEFLLVDGMPFQASSNPFCNCMGAVTPGVMNRCHNSGHKRNTVFGFRPTTGVQVPMSIDKQRFILVTTNG